MQISTPRLDIIYGQRFHDLKACLHLLLTTTHPSLPGNHNTSQGHHAAKPAQAEHISCLEKIEADHVVACSGSSEERAPPLVVWTVDARPCLHKRLHCFGFARDRGVHQRSPSRQVLRFEVDHRLGADLLDSCDVSISVESVQRR